MKRMIAGLLLLGASVFGAYAQIPEMKLKDIKGKTIQTELLNEGGKPVVVSFFATWV